MSVDVVTYPVAGPLRRGIRRVAATRPMAWVFARTVHHLDRGVHRATRGRTTATAVLTGLPLIMLTTTGARSGRPRTVPLVALPHGDALVVIASNYGQHRHPGWYHNLRAHPEATVGRDGASTEVVARLATPAERDELWPVAESVYPGFADYRRRAAHRQIAVFLLDPV